MKNLPFPYWAASLGTEQSQVLFFFSSNDFGTPFLDSKYEEYQLFVHKEQTTKTKPACIGMRAQNAGNISSVLTQCMPYYDGK